MASDKIIHKAFRIHKILRTKPSREISHFQYLPKLGFNMWKFLFDVPQCYQVCK